MQPSPTKRNLKQTKKSPSAILGSAYSKKQEEPLIDSALLRSPSQTKQKSPPRGLFDSFSFQHGHQLLTLDDHQQKIKKVPKVNLRNEPPFLDVQMTRSIISIPEPNNTEQQLNPQMTQRSMTGQIQNQVADSSDLTQSQFEEYNLKDKTQQQSQQSEQKPYGFEQFYKENCPSAYQDQKRREKERESKIYQNAKEQIHKDSLKKNSNKNNKNNCQLLNRARTITYYEDYQKEESQYQQSQKEGKHFESQQNEFLQQNLKSNQKNNKDQYHYLQRYQEYEQQKIASNNQDSYENQEEEMQQKASNSKSQNSMKQTFKNNNNIQNSRKNQSFSQNNSLQKQKRKLIQSSQSKQKKHPLYPAKNLNNTPQYGKPPLQSRRGLKKVQSQKSFSSNDSPLKNLSNQINFQLLKEDQIFSPELRQISQYYKHKQQIQKQKKLQASVKNNQFIESQKKKKSPQKSSDKKQTNESKKFASPQSKLRTNEQQYLLNSEQRTPSLSRQIINSSGGINLTKLSISEQNSSQRQSVNLNQFNIPLKRQTMRRQFNRFIQQQRTQVQYLNLLNRIEGQMKFSIRDPQTHLQFAQFSPQVDIRYGYAEQPLDLWKRLLKEYHNELFSYLDSLESLKVQVQKKKKQQNKQISLRIQDERQSTLKTNKKIIGKENQNPNTNSTKKERNNQSYRQDQISPIQQSPIERHSQNPQDSRHFQGLLVISNHSRKSRAQPPRQKQIKKQKTQRKVKKFYVKQQKSKDLSYRLHQRVKSSVNTVDEAKLRLSQLIQTTQNAQYRHHLQDLHGMIENIDQGIRIARYQRKLMAKNLKKSKNMIIVLQTITGASLELNQTMSKQFQQEFKKNFYKNRVRQLRSQQNRQFLEPFQAELFSEYYQRHDNANEPYNSQTSESESQMLGYDSQRQQKIDNQYYREQQEQMVERQTVRQNKGQKKTQKVLRKKPINDRIIYPQEKPEMRRNDRQQNDSHYQMHQTPKNSERGNEQIQQSPVFWTGRANAQELLNLIQPVTENSDVIQYKSPPKKTPYNKKPVMQQSAQLIIGKKNNTPSWQRPIYYNQHINQERKQQRRQLYLQNQQYKHIYPYELQRIPYESIDYQHEQQNLNQRPRQIQPDQFMQVQQQPNRIQRQVSLLNERQNRIQGAEQQINSTEIREQRRQYSYKMKVRDTIDILRCCKIFATQNQRIDVQRISQSIKQENIHPELLQQLQSIFSNTRLSLVQLRENFIRQNQHVKELQQKKRLDQQKFYKKEKKINHHPQDFCQLFLQGPNGEQVFKILTQASRQDGSFISQALEYRITMIFQYLNLCFELHDEREIPNKINRLRIKDQQIRSKLQVQKHQFPKANSMNFAIDMFFDILEGIRVSQ